MACSAESWPAHSVGAQRQAGNESWRFKNSSATTATPAGAIDILARIMSMGKLHHAMTGTGAVAIAVAGAIPGTLVSRQLGSGAQSEVTFGHPSGTLRVGAEAKEVAGEWAVTKAIMSRSARRLMTGQVFVPMG